MARIILITGGARSGKSGYAQNLAASMPGAKAYIATCPPAAITGDEEMALRIERHRQDRLDKGWTTIEEQLDLAGTIRNSDSFELLLIDCLTLWLNNLLHHRGEQPLTEDDVIRLGEELLLACKSYQGTVIMVTNEVGLGIVPENPLARKYRDLVGRCNQVLAAGADEVVLVVAGLPLTIKK